MLSNFFKIKKNQKIKIDFLIKNLWACVVSVQKAAGGLAHVSLNSKLNSLSDGILGFAVAFTQLPLGVGSIISRHPVVNFLKVTFTQVAQILPLA